MSISPHPVNPGCGDDRPIEDILAEIRAYAAVAMPRDGMNGQPRRALRDLHVSAAAEPGADLNHTADAPRGRPAATCEADAVPSSSPAHPVMRAEAVDLPSVLRRANPVQRAPAASVHPFPRPVRRLTEALRAVQPAQDIVTDGSRSAQAAPAPADGEPPRRMASFLDKRFKALSQPPSPSVPAVEAAPVPAEAPGAPPTFADLDAALGGNRAAIAKVLGREGTAELLRPMLKQWLLENMPRIVEQALTLEMSENAVKTEHRTRA